MTIQLPLFKNLVVMSVSGTPGVGTVTLATSVAPYLTVVQAGIPDGARVTYSFIDGSSNSEIGQGTIGGTGTTLTRDTVYRSTGAGNTAKISLSGAAICELTLAAEDVMAMTAPNFRNALYANGGCEIFQRGADGSASFAIAASTPGYTADRWYFTNNATQASVVSQQAGLNPQSRYALRALRNSGQTGVGVMRLEYAFTTDEVIALRGQPLSLQLWLKAGAGFSPTSGNVVVNAYFGTGTEGRRGAGAYTSESNPLSATFAATTTAAQFQFTSNTLVGTTVTQGCLQISWTPVSTAGANDSIDIDDVQLEGMAFSTPFERITRAAAITECQRHYCKSFPMATAPAQNAGIPGAVYGPNFAGDNSGLAGSATIGVSFPVRMRGTPSPLTIYNPRAADTKMATVVPGAGTDLTSTLAQASETGFYVNNAGTTTVTASGDLGVSAIHYTADASL